MSFLGSIGKAIGGLVSGAVNIATGHPAQAVGSVLGGFGVNVGGSSPTTSIPMPAFAGGGGNLPSIPSNFPGAVPVPTSTGALQRLLPGGKTGYTAPYSGYHVNKRYREYLIGKDMGKDLVDPTKRPQVVNPIVKNRKMNPLNPRALQRANARQHAAVRLMRRTLRGTGYRISRSGFGGKKTTRRR